MSGEVCEELIFEIFTRLPPKSLLRFRSLCKSFCSYIASPGFISMHTVRSPKKVLITHETKKENGIDNFCTLYSEDQLPLFPRRAYIGITTVEFPFSKYSRCVGSCNGILCMFDCKEYSINLWNPSIRRKLTLPDCPTSPCPQCSCGVRRVGFGFDPVTDDYKIVSLRQATTEEPSYVYSMKKGVWCEIASSTPLNSSYYMTSWGCFVNGALHWVIFNKLSKSDYILTFNLSTDIFGIIALPLLEPSWLCELTTIQGSLAVVSTNGRDNCIWVMREYNDDASWSVVFKSKENQFQGYLQRVLQPTSNGDLFFLTLDKRFHVYDLKMKAQSRLQNLDADRSIIDMETCVESLQLLDIWTACQGS
ncbi:hypothetical protein L1887_40155 [Cichorium endivia]|nr:hypothetical protein L1887_40155 [Cichorium endivia]